MQTANSPAWKKLIQIAAATGILIPCTIVIVGVLSPNQNQQKLHPLAELNDTEHARVFTVKTLCDIEWERYETELEKHRLPGSHMISMPNQGESPILDFPPDCRWTITYQRPEEFETREKWVQHMIDQRNEQVRHEKN